MSPDEQSIRDACLSAAAELGVRVVTPFTLAGDDGSPVEFIALCPDFGGPNGTAVCYFRDWPVKREAASARGYYCSGLHPDSFARYDRDQFVDAFVDWGWQGSESGRAAWCKS